MNPNDPGQPQQPPEQPQQPIEPVPQPAPAPMPSPQPAPVHQPQMPVAPAPAPVEAVQPSPQPQPAPMPVDQPAPGSVGPAAPVAPQAPAPMQPGGQPMQPQQMQQPGMGQPAMGGAPKSGNKTKLIAIIAAVVILVIGFAVVLILLLGGESYQTVTGTGSISGATVEYPSSYTEGENDGDASEFYADKIVIEGCTIEDADSNSIQRGIGVGDLSETADTKTIAEFTDQIENAVENESGITLTIEEDGNLTRVQITGVPDSVSCDGETKETKITFIYYLLEGSGDKLYAGIAGIPYEGDEAPSVQPEDGHAKEMLVRFEANNPDLF